MSTISDYAVDMSRKARNSSRRAMEEHGRGGSFEYGLDQAEQADRDATSANLRQGEPEAQRYHRQAMRNHLKAARIHRLQASPGDLFEQEHLRAMRANIKAGIAHLHGHAESPIEHYEAALSHRNLLLRHQNALENSGRISGSGHKTSIAAHNKLAGMHMQASKALPRSHREIVNAFLTAIHHNPQDSATHLIYGDWLEENGYPQEAENRRQIGYRLEGRVPNA